MSRILVVGPSGSGLSAALRIMSEKSHPILIVDDNLAARQRDIIAQSIAEDLLKRSHNEMLRELFGRAPEQLPSLAEMRQRDKIIADSKVKQKAKEARRAKRFK